MYQPSVWDATSDNSYKNMFRQEVDYKPNQNLSH